jgi:hypothetical protein
MTADIVLVCDAIATGLTGQVSGLAGATVHKYEPWDPTDFVVDNRRHLAVWPAGENTGAAEETESLAQNTDEGHQIYMITVWESGRQEAARRASDETRAKALLQVHNDVRDWFYVEANQNLAGSEYVQYLRTRFPDRSSTKRWFRMEVRVDRFLGS